MNSAPKVAEWLNRLNDQLLPQILDLEIQLVDTLGLDIDQELSESDHSLSKFQTALQTGRSELTSTIEQAQQLHNECQQLAQTQPISLPDWSSYDIKQPESNSEAWLLEAQDCVINLKNWREDMENILIEWSEEIILQG